MEIIAKQSKMLLVHQFSLSHITGITVMIKEFLRLFPTQKECIASYISFSGTLEDFIRELDEKHYDTTYVIGINLHIEVKWEYSLALLQWCKVRHIPICIYIHDYWPHHFGYVATVVENGAKLLASTKFLQDSR